MFLEGESVSCGWLLCKAARSDREPGRFGCAIRRGVFPKATQRNRMKRWLRSAYRLHPKEIPSDVDLVVVVRERPPEESYQTAEQSLLLGCRRLQQLFV